MRKQGNQIIYSASDLITFMQSRFASWMDRRKLEDPAVADLMDKEDPLMGALQRKGYAHEDAFTDELKAKGYDVLEIKKASLDVMQAETLKAMQSGRDLIPQGYLIYGQFAGYTDYLKRVDGKSLFGEWHYEVWDAKLSKRVKAYFIIQLCCYAEMLEAIQGVRPEYIQVVLGSGEKPRFRVNDFFAYYKCLKEDFLSLQNVFDKHDDPDPTKMMKFGRWSEYAESKLREIDHPYFVAGISNSQIVKLGRAGISTMSALASSPLTHIRGIGDDTFYRLQSQAAIQKASVNSERPLYEVLSHEGGLAKGISLLPPHSPSDVFFDIEGYPLVEGGLEYLWGNTYYTDDGGTAFRDFWAHDHEQEKITFEAFIDWIYARWKNDTSMHVYHYASYEITAIKKLMSRYATREEEVDNLLRNHVFVDLYSVVKHGLRVGVESYSIKKIENLYRGKRETDVASGGESVVVYEAWREKPDGDKWETSAILNDIRKYNIDDCDSTMELAIWLRGVQQDNNIEYLVSEGAGEKELDEKIIEVHDFRDQLIAYSISQQNELYELCAQLLEFHRREDKPRVWLHFERVALNEEELFDDMECLAGLERTSQLPYKPTPRARNLAYQYSYDTDQQFKGKMRNVFIIGEEEFTAKVVELDPENGLITLQTKSVLPDYISIIPNDRIPTKPIPEAIKDVVEKITGNDFSPCAITDFLKRVRPRIVGNSEGQIIADQDEYLDQTIDAAINLDGSYLCIQGPPGSGKTYTATHIIGELLKRGKRVGISSNSHKAILNLLRGVDRHITKKGISAQLVKRGGESDDPLMDDTLIRHISKIEDVPASAAVCFGDTAWGFSNQKLIDSFDYLFIDEAGQVSIANLVGMSRSATNLILMGDQMQLSQPTQASHPGQSGQSILEYLLEDHATIPSDLGVFLPHTYRMHPEVCKLVSDQVYEGRLGAAKETLDHEIKVMGPLITKNAGIVFIPVEHEGNAQGSEEEVAKICELVNELIGSYFWPDKEGQQRSIGLKDILIVAPYNYQVNLLKAALGDDAKIGSVDKFQGQEAPIVILSMCASDASESPRGIDFLFSKNRLNVALSRAQALAIVVGNPKLSTTPVHSIEQMAKINFYCEIVQQ